MVKTINFPEFEQGENATESLLNFYVSLGWDRQQNLNPRKVVINNKQALELIDKITSEEDDKAKVNLMYLNFGPSPDEDIQYGKIKLRSGWLQNEEE